MVANPLAEGCYGGVSDAEELDVQGKGDHFTE